MTLLNNTRLHLKRGCCYGLCGPNDCGKSTLLKAINNEQAVGSAWHKGPKLQVDGFPPKSELVTAFVEHGVGETEPECELGDLRDSVSGMCKTLKRGRRASFSQVDASGIYLCR